MEYLSLGISDFYWLYWLQFNSYVMPLILTDMDFSLLYFTFTVISDDRTRPGMLDKNAKQDPISNM